MKFLVACLLLTLVGFSTSQWIVSPITGYHFHTYFYQDDQASKAQALTFRNQIAQLIRNGSLAECSLNKFNTKPVGPHPVGSYETCCNSSSINNATSWFMQNHGNLSVLLHPLTRYEVEDHTVRAMWLGPSFPLNLHPLTPDLKKPPTCEKYHNFMK